MIVEVQAATTADGTVEWRALAGETIPLDELPRVLATAAGGRARKRIVDPRG